MEQGVEIGNRARRLYSEGILVSEKNLEDSFCETERLLNNIETSAIFEGTFLVGAYVAKADILVRENTGWHLIEVKSSGNDKPELLDDLAYTYMVLTRAGLLISQASLMLISKDYRLGMEDNSLFIEVDHSDDAKTRALQFDQLWDQVDGYTSGSRPQHDVIFQCKDCSLIDDCLGEEVRNPVFDLPRLSQKKFDSLKEMGVINIEDVPQDFDLTPHQTTVRECIVCNKPWKSPQLNEYLDNIQLPAYYLDFETVTTAIPLYPDIAPFIQIPTQYSVHKWDGKTIEHREHLSNPSKDSREELARHLIADLEKHGSIVTYSSFEKTTVNNLIKLYPGLSAQLQQLVDRMVDLEPIIRKGFYHPEFHGRSSIKVVLPVVVPDLSYKGLEIANGDCAIAAFAYMALGKTTGTEAEKVKADLLKYCALDTLAMVKLHEQLCKW